MPPKILRKKVLSTVWPAVWSALGSIGLGSLGSVVGFQGASALGGTSCASTDELDKRRHKMVVEQLEARDITDPRVLAAMRTVPRHAFVPQALQSRAYSDHALPIGEGQTISQPYIVALMTQLAELAPGDKVLEIGTGSGYQSAILDAMDAEVFTIEIVPTLADKAAALFDTLSLENIHSRTGNGYLGWPDEAPFDAILVTAAPPKIPEALIQQLSTHGHLVVPVGPRDDTQVLMRVTKREDGSLEHLEVTPVRFVPMVERP